MNRQMAVMGLAGAAGGWPATPRAGRTTAQYASTAQASPRWSGSSPTWASPAATKHRRTKSGFTSTTWPAGTRGSSATFFQHMIDMGLDKTPAIESDHPTLKSRVEAANGASLSSNRPGRSTSTASRTSRRPAEFHRASRWPCKRLDGNAERPAGADRRSRCFRRCPAVAGCRTIRRT